MTRRRLATLAASTALHAALLLLIVLVVTRESDEGALFIDLTHWVGSESGGLRLAAGRPTPAPAPRPLRGLDAPAPRPATPRAALAPPPPAVGPAPAAPAAPPPSRAPAAVTEPSPPPIVAIGTGDAAGRGAPGGADPATARVGVAPGAGGPPRGAGARDDVGAAPDVSRGLALAAGGSAAPAAEYGPYLSRLRRHVQASLRYPPTARRRGLQGTVTLEIVIRPDGTLGGVTLADSSSHALLDDAALETVRALAPGPFPPGVAPRLLRVRLPVVFALD